MFHGHLRVEDGVPVIEFFEQADHLAAVAGVLDTKQRVVETVQMHTVDEPAGQVRHLPIAACGFEHVGLDQLAAGVRMLDVGRARHGMPLQVVCELSATRKPWQVSDIVGHGRQRRRAASRGRRRRPRARIVFADRPIARLVLEAEPRIAPGRRRDLRLTP